MSRVRMAEVAVRAGVSSVTVSRVLRHPAKVATATRRRVQSAIMELGYGAAGVTLTEGGLVAALIPTIDNALHAEIVQAMQERLRDAGLHLLLGCTEFLMLEEEALLRAVLAQKPAAVSLTGITHSAASRELLRKARIPTVELTNLTPDPIDMAVGYSGRAAARAVVEFLLARGRRRIAYVHSPVGDDDRLRDRHRGYAETLEAAGLEGDCELVIETPLSFAGGARALVRLLERRTGIDAVFCSNDVLAAGVLFECLRRGLPVPERLAVAGFDDLPIAEEVVPALTTVRIPRRRIGETAAELILARLAGQAVATPVIDVGYEIVRRVSA
jgi:LacI family transcriptional regulator, gluconate utilization system Gnt-I transcriptional repressor